MNKNCLLQHLLLVPCDQVGHWCGPERERKRRRKKGKRNITFLLLLSKKNGRSVCAFSPHTFYTLELNLKGDLYNVITTNNLSTTSSGSCGESLSPLPIYHSELSSFSKGGKAVLSCSFPKIRLFGSNLNARILHLELLSGTKLFNHKWKNTVH